MARPEGSIHARANLSYFDCMVYYTSGIDRRTIEMNLVLSLARALLSEYFRSKMLIRG